MSTSALASSTKVGDVVATLPVDGFRRAAGWMTLVRDVIGERPDAIGDLRLLKWQLEEAANEVLEPGPDPLLVAQLWYGLRGEDPTPPHQVGMKLGYSRERIRRVHQRLIHRLGYPRYSRSIRAGFFSYPPDADRYGREALLEWKRVWAPRDLTSDARWE
ncbi:MAG TPA: hypothetical protein VGR71_08345 [Nitrospira sp.]|nr:hypothetical protein [Nitrospira sp.]